MLPVFLGFLGLLTAAYVLAPLRPGARVEVAAGRGGSYHEPEAEVQRQLQELELDHDLQKVDDDDYEARRASLTAELGSSPVAAAPRKSWQDADIEAEILIARARKRHTTAASAEWSCAKCGRVMANEDRFCASCGTPREA